MHIWIGLIALAGAVAAPALAQKKIPNPPPVIIQTVPTPPAIETYGSWTVNRFGSGWASYTTNESGSVFGVFCKDGCVAYFNAQTSCEAKGMYPALINGSDGAFSVNMECAVINKRYLMTAPISTSLISSFEMGGELGIAFPLQSGKFQVSRFSLTGALKAANRVAALADTAKTDKPSEKTLQDYKL